AIVGLSPDGVIVSWNHGAERMYEYGSAEVIGKHSSILSPPMRRKETYDIQASIQSGATISHFETVHMTRRERPIYVSLTVSPIRAPKGELSGISTIARNITGRKQAEAALQLTQSSVDQAPFAIVWFDPRGQIVYANHSASEPLGYSREE